MEALHFSLFRYSNIIKDYNFSVEEFDNSYFYTIIFDIIADYFSTGVRVNGTTYTCGPTPIPLVNSDIHIPTDYHGGFCMLFLNKILAKVDEKDFSDSARLDLLDQLGDLTYEPMHMRRAIFKTTNAAKTARYEEYIRRSFSVDRVESSREMVEEIQGTSATISLDKLREVKVEDDSVVIAEDTSFYMDCLHGMPGPYVSHIWDTVTSTELSMNVSDTGKSMCMYQSSMSAKCFINNNLIVVTSNLQCTGLWLIDNTVNVSTFDYHFSPGGNPRKKTMAMLYSTSIYWLKFRLKIQAYDVKPRKRTRVI